MLRFWVIREINSLFRSKTQGQMFLLVSGRHVGAHVHGTDQHGVSIQISINLGKTFFRISSMRKIAVTWILARVFAYVPSFYFHILDLIYWMVLTFFYLFWMAWHWKALKLATLNISSIFQVFNTDTKDFCKPVTYCYLTMGNRKLLFDPLVQFVWNREL